MLRQQRPKIYIHRSRLSLYFTEKKKGLWIKTNTGRRRKHLAIVLSLKGGKSQRSHKEQRGRRLKSIFTTILWVLKLLAYIMAPHQQQLVATATRENHNCHHTSLFSADRVLCTDVATVMSEHSSESELESGAWACKTMRMKKLVESISSKSKYCNSRMTMTDFNTVKGLSKQKQCDKNLCESKTQVKENLALLASDWQIYSEHETSLSLMLLTYVILKYSMMNIWTVL